MFKLYRFYFVIVILLLASCVTINVYFPSAAAEKAADRIIEEVWGDKERPDDEKDNSSEKSDKQSFLIDKILNIVISPAYAAANIDISSPVIQNIKDRMARRHKKIEKFYDQGAIGLTNDALIAMHDSARVALRERSKVKTWIKDENSDRLELYREIAIANNHPEWESNIRATFAKRWIKRAKKGWWYKDKSGNWKRK